MSLFDEISRTLQQEGSIPFVDFMHQALYNPAFGYYSSGSQKFGLDGDFITAPELTPLFGQTLANQCQQILRVIKNPVIFEFGAGTGQLCVDMLTHLAHINALPDAYIILELSGDLQQRQKKLIQNHIPHLEHRIQWVSEWPKTPFNGVMIANEVLDAMPIHRFLKTDDNVLESYVSVNPNQEWVETFKPCNNPRLLTHLAPILPNLPTPYQSEANLFINDWIQQCFQSFGEGALFILDYGYPRHEYYHPDRHQGTLMCHYRHHAHINPFIHLGEQDITAHVDFTHVAEAALDAGFHVAGYTNQASFLVANGLLSLLEAIKDDHARIRAQQAIKQLLHPTEMGELFKVIALTKQIDLPLTGFQWLDKRASL